MKYISKIALTSYFLMGCMTGAEAHFVEMTAKENVIIAQRGKTINLEMSFTHPFEGGPLMEFVKPLKFGVMMRGKKQSLLEKMKPIEGFENLKWEVSHDVKRSGDYVFFVEPKAYFEPAEGKMIIHYTKTVINYQSDNGWDEAVGFPVEIMPLTRPYGIWTNNLFRGVVLHNAKPVPFAAVEVEMKNTQGIKAPNDAYITQVIKADANGVFAYAIPKAGWWGFAALIEDGETMMAPDNKEYPIEKGALIWVKAEDM